MILKSPTKLIRLRGRDKFGNGWYGASRGVRKHEGLDFCCVPDEEIFSPISGKAKVGYVYVGSKNIKLIEIIGYIKEHKYKVKIMYVQPDIQTGDYVEKNQLIGKAQNISKYHNEPSMKNHVHVSVWKNDLLTDPEPLFTGI